MSKSRKLLFTTTALMLLNLQISNTQIDSLRTKIAMIAKSIKGKVGVALQLLGNKDTLTFNGDEKFPMQSVYKFPLALAVLHQVDKGKLSLDQKIHLTKKDLLPDTHSPLRDKYPNGNVDVTLGEILSYTVSQSDNNGCDVLFRLLGGPKEVDKYIHSIGVTNISIAATEEEMHQAWNVQYTNWCTPMAMEQLLDLSFQKNILSKKSKDFLWQVMVETTTGPNRIKGMLPKETIVAHKTGTGGRNEEGIVGAINDVGIIVLPSGQHVAITIFITTAPEETEVLENVIARISQAIYLYYTK